MLCPEVYAWVLVSGGRSRRPPGWRSTVLTSSTALPPRAARCRRSRGRQSSQRRTRASRPSTTSALSPCTRTWCSGQRVGYCFMCSCTLYCCIAGAYRCNTLYCCIAGANRCNTAWSHNRCHFSWANGLCLRLRTAHPSHLVGRSGRGRTVKHQVFWRSVLGGTRAEDSHRDLHEQQQK